MLSYSNNNYNDLIKFDQIYTHRFYTHRCVHLY